MLYKRPDTIARLGIAALLAIAGAVAAGMRRGEPPRVTVMTWNIYNGMNDPIGRPDMSAVAQSIFDTRFDLRADSIARIIGEQRPHIISLQEVAYWQGLVHFEIINENFLTRLQDRLLAQGLSYVVVGKLQSTDFDDTFDPDPPFASHLRWRDRIVLLALDSSQVEVLNVRTRTFTDFFQVAGSSLDFRRGWIAADIAFRGQRARYVCTHLEERSSSMRQSQASQLVDWLDITDQPVIVMGDMSSEPASAVYNQFTNAGFSDAWLANHALFDGPTCCQTSDLTNAASALTRRTDFVFVRGAATPVSASRVGNKQADRTPEPTNLWPSDHAGVVAKIQLP